MDMQPEGMGAMDVTGGQGPINPFPKADFSVLGFVDLSSILPVIFAIVLMVWLAYTLVVTYHWFRYGHRSFLTVPLLAIHVTVSGMAILIAAGGLR